MKETINFYKQIISQDNVDTYDAAVKQAFGTEQGYKTALDKMFKAELKLARLVHENSKTIRKLDYYPKLEVVSKEVLEESVNDVFA